MIVFDIAPFSPYRSAVDCVYLVIKSCLLTISGYNKKHGITPTTVVKAISKAIQDESKLKEKDTESAKTKGMSLDMLRKQMVQAAKNLEFEEAARLRDVIKARELKQLLEI